MGSRRHRQLKTKYKRLLCGLGVLLGLPILIKLMILSLPYLSATAAKTAVFSAGIAMPEGGIVLMDKAGQETARLPSELSVPSEPSSENEEPEQTASEPEVTSEQPRSEPVSVSSASSQTSSQTKPANAGKIVRQTYGGGTSNIYLKLQNNAYLKNSTKLSISKIKTEIAKTPDVKLQKSDKPTVLIMHTHTTEAYEPQARDYYDKSYNSRTRDNTKNMVRVGDEIEKQLKAAGIGVIHDKTVHDYPSYNGAYDRSAVTVKNILKKNPSIQVVLDVHRDAIQRTDGTRIAPVAKINGKNAAQVMIISGCDDGTMGYPNYFKNLRFATRLQQQLEGDYKGLTRPILFDYRKYNQNLTAGSILLEMGSNSNSLDEAIYTGELVGKSLAKTLKNLK